MSMTHRDLAAAVGVSETTIKSYRRKFPGFVPVAGYGKPIRFEDRALEVCRAIREGFDRGLSVAQVEARLRKLFEERPGDLRYNASRSGGRGGVDAALVERVLESAAGMLERVAAISEAQARADVRLQRVEDALAGLVREQVALRTRQERILERLEGESQGAGPGEVAGSRVTARRIVNVRDRDGRVERYELQDEPAPEAETAGKETTGPTPNGAANGTRGSEAEPGGGGAGEATRPAADFLELPLVVRTQAGDFVGVPDRLDVARLVGVCESLSGGPEGVRWSREPDGEWTLSFSRLGVGMQVLHVERTTTPRGNEVAHLARLERNGAPLSQERLMAFFRLVRSRL